MAAVKSSATASLRLLALPLARRPDRAARSDASMSLVYFLAAQPASSAQPTQQLSYLSRATNFGANQWAKLGQAKPGNWKNRLYVGGEKLMDRIAFEEWSLKSLDTSLAPALPLPSSASSHDPSEKPRRIPMYFPSRFVSESYLRGHLHELLAHRQPHHSSRIKYCVIGMPFTIPFAIIPVIPNIPFLYLLWRAWSHWRAWTSSKYLAQLLNDDLIAFTPSSELDSIFERAAPRRSPSGIPETPTEQPPTATSPVLLRHDMLPDILRKFELRQTVEGELSRAIDQIEVRLRQASEEARSGASASAKESGNEKRS